MSTYQKMWLKIIDLDEQETKDWINAVDPVRGYGIDFRGVRVNDADVMEALRNHLEDLRRKERLVARKLTDDLLSTEIDREMNNDKTTTPRK